jgi:hypothetical protein
MCVAANKNLDMPRRIFRHGTGGSSTILSASVLRLISADFSPPARRQYACVVPHIAQRNRKNGDRRHENKRRIY